MVNQVDGVAAEPDPTPPVQLPPLSILHLLTWTTVTALSLVPFNLQQEVYRRLSPQTANTSAITVVNVVVGLAAGTHLFVAGSVWRWRRLGLRTLLEPGHWLAMGGVLNWISMLGTWALIALAQTGSFPMSLTWAPQSLVGLCVFVWFGVLAIKSGHAVRWRLVFSMVAMAPLARFLARFFIAWSIRPTSPVEYFRISMLCEGIIMAAPTAAIGVAILGDLSRRARRHWSHWLATMASIVAATSIIAYYFWSWQHSPA
jgi:hypothetical protein